MIIKRGVRVHFEIVNYLKENLGKFDIPTLKNELLKSGHHEEDINEALHEVLDTEKTETKEDLPIFPDPFGDYKKPEIKNKEIKKESVKQSEKIYTPLSLDGLEEKEEIHPFHKGIRKYYNHKNLVIFYVILGILTFIAIIYAFL